MDTLVVKKNDGIVIGDKVKVSRSFLGRLKGLLGTSTLNHGEGILLAPCNSVHTFFMKYSIDVVFMSKEKKVIKIIHSMVPYRISPIISKSYFVMELPKDTCNRLELRCGEKLCF